MPAIVRFGLSPLFGNVKGSEPVIPDNAITFEGEIETLTFENEATVLTFEI